MDWSFKLWSSVHLMIATKLSRTVWRDLLTRKANRKLPDSLSLKAECGYWTIKPQILLLRRASLSSALKLTYLKHLYYAKHCNMQHFLSDDKKFWLLHRTIQYASVRDCVSTSFEKTNEVCISVRFNFSITCVRSVFISF